MTIEVPEYLARRIEKLVPRVRAFAMEFDARDGEALRLAQIAVVQRGVDSAERAWLREVDGEPGETP
jgi:hypothetical protein